MKRLLPFPLLSLALLATWLLLNQTLAAGHVLLGAVIAVGGGLALALLQPPGPMVRRPAAIAALAWLVLVDIVRSNVAGARIVINPGHRRQTSGFLDIPLELRDPAGLAVLACIITATPGTAWARYDSAQSVLTMHILDLVDEDTWIRTIKDRYERRLLEIFG
ncbi:MAG: Na+/H+ antiporter subunit E [Burkholderiales bacterium]